MGMYDLPAVIHYIRSVARQPKIYYIGHSMGSTSFFGMHDADQANYFIYDAN